MSQHHSTRTYAVRARSTYRTTMGAEMSREVVPAANEEWKETRRAANNLCKRTMFFVSRTILAILLASKAFFLCLSISKVTAFIVPRPPPSLFHRRDRSCAATKDCWCSPLSWLPSDTNKLLRFSYFCRPLSVSLDSGIDDDVGTGQDAKQLLSATEGIINGKDFKNDERFETLDTVIPTLKHESITASSHDQATTTAAPFSSSWLTQTIFLGIKPTPEILAIMTIYFVEGTLGLARLAQTFYLKDTLHLGPAELSALMGIFTIPWTIKPLYGFLSDGFPLWGYRRRSYLIVAGVVGFFCYFALGFNFWGVFDASTPGDQVRATIAAFVVSSASIACSDVVADGIVVQRTRDSNDPTVAGGLQSLCWGSAAVGGLLSAYFSGSLLEIMGAQKVFTISSILPLLVAAIALAIDEAPSRHRVTPNERKTGIQDQIEALWSALKLPAVWRPALFLFLWQSTPTSEGAFLYFMTNDLGMGPEFLGRVRLVTAAAGLLGVWAYQKYFRSVPIKDILFWTSIASTPLGLSQLLLVTHMNRDLGIPDGAFVFGDDVALAILGQLAFLPTLVLAARICPPGVEAVLFATLMSIFNGASAVGTEVGALLTKMMGVTESNFDNLAWLTFICNISSLYPLLFIGWLKDVGSQSEVEIENAPVLDVATFSQKGIIGKDDDR